ncbi:histidinol-phosphatase HisJ [Tepidibacillus marianensis]|uniref:histidinol-phosphatase HisJ n=1 Tax=Tepidibacillus marianensis TaxID=3131995 RepID=UPI0030CFE98E
MFIDYHTHNERCGHADGQLRNYIEQGIKVGLDQLGLSDHMPIIHLPKEKIPSGTAMELHQLEEYVREAVDLKKEYQGQIDIKVGIEADYIESYEREIEMLLSPYPFDYIIGSAHFLGEWDHSDSRQMEGWQRKSVDEIFSEYYRAIQGLAKSGLYDIVGHFDVIKKHGHVPKGNIMPVIEQSLQVIRDQDMAMEVNSSGLYKIVKEIFPAPNIIEKALALGIPFTLGSDAHKPEHVHVGVEEGRKVLQQLGATQIATFDQRKRIMVGM